MCSILFTALLVVMALHAGQSVEERTCQNILQGFLIGQEVTSIGYKNLESMKHDLTKAVKAVRKEYKEAIKSSEKGLRNSFSSFVKNRAKSNIIYTRWGRKDCPKHAELLYTGFVGGSHYSHTGGAAESLCLPSENAKFREKGKADVAYVYGAEYEVDYLPDKRGSLHNHKVPCAVCTRRGKSVVKMFPAMDSCPGKTTMEYTGFLMAGYAGHASATEYTCFDADIQPLDGAGQVNNNGRLFYTVTAQCGALKCPPYKQGKELLCTVCSM